jgi:3-deoxy-D-manno-octulosonate 8-phosphate phosphatase KdsC-like HAD superfamily phosphatase
VFVGYLKGITTRKIARALKITFKSCRFLGDQVVDPGFMLKYRVQRLLALSVV